MDRGKDMATDFAATFTAFVEEGKKAFPGNAAILAAERAFAEDSEGAERGFAADCLEHGCLGLLLSPDESLLQALAKTRLLQGFEVPADAPDANRKAVLDYAVQLVSLAWAAANFQEGTMQQLRTVFDQSSFLQDQPEDLDLKKLMTSPEGQALTTNIAKVFGMDIDMSSPEAKQAMGMMQMMLF